jgi:Peptidase_C39 like family
MSETDDRPDGRTDDAGGDDVPDRHIAFGWLDLAAADAERDGVEIAGGALTVTEPAGQRDYTDPFGDSGTRSYDYATWISPPQSIPFPATSVVVSWAAQTPGSSWVGIAVRGRSAGAKAEADAKAEAGADTDTDTHDDDWTPWLVVARWADGDEEIHPTSVPGQSADGATAETDEIRIEPESAWTSYQVRVILFRHNGDPDQPRLTRLGVMQSAVPHGRDADVPPTSRPTLAKPVDLDVPTYSQQLHRDQHPRYDGGGQSWCSPTSVAMVLAHFDALPPPHEYAWVEPQQADRFVPFIARACFDHAYGGSGNWAFNTAYAATQGMEAFVTRLRSLAEAETFLAAGIPLILSLAFEEDELTGAGYDTKGHLMVLTGFTDTGDPIVNDPASHRIVSDAAVRTTYRRDQVEALWLRSSGGVVYVMHPPELPLPPAPAEPNW